MNEFEQHEHNGIDTKRISGKNIVGAPQPTIQDPSGGATVDAEARQAIMELIDTLQALGFIK